MKQKNKLPLLGNEMLPPVKSTKMSSILRLLFTRTTFTCIMAAACLSSMSRTASAQCPVTTGYGPVIEASTLPVGTTNWQTPLAINGIVEVPSGATLNIAGVDVGVPYALQDNIITFAENTGIRIHRGGTLNITMGNPILSHPAGCNQFWLGISVISDADDAGNPTIVNMSQGGSIEYAITAIQAVSFFDNDFYQAEDITVSNVQFYNNIHAFSSRQSQSGGLYNPTRRFSNCSFRIDDDLPTNPSPEDPLLMADIYSSSTNSFSNCTFDDQRTNPTAKENFPSTAVRAAVDGHLTLQGNTFQNMNTAVYASLLDGMQVTGNTFKSLTDGIIATNGPDRFYIQPKGYLITGNTFTGAIHGITLYGGTGNQIGGPGAANRNTFNIPSAPFPYDYSTWGIELVGESDFLVQNNSFSGGVITGTGYYPTNYGVVVMNTGAAPGSIFNNDFSKSLGKPSSDWQVHVQDGNMTTRIRCNSFTNPGIAGIAVFDNLRDQGVNCIKTFDNSTETNTNQAGNEWRFVSGTEGDIKIQSGSPVFKYWAHELDVSLAPSTEPLKSTAAWAYNNSSNPFDPNNHLTVCQGVNKTSSSCDNSTSQFNTPPLGGPIVLPELPTIGDCNKAFNRLQTAIVSGAAQSKVLWTTINTTIALPATKKLLDNLGRQADNLTADLTDWSAAVVRMTAQQCPNLRSQSEGLLKNVPLTEVQKLLAGIQSAAGNLPAALKTLTGMLGMNNPPQIYNAVAKAALQADNAQYVRLTTMLLNAAKQGRKIVVPGNNGTTTTQLTPSELQTVKSVAAAKVKTSVYAENLLTALYGTVFPHPIKRFTNLGNNLRKGKADTAGDAPASKYQLVPQPAADQTVLHVYDTEQSGKNLSVIVYNLMGQQLPVKTETISDTDILIHTENLASGTYLYMLRADNELIHSDKLVIIK